MKSAKPSTTIFKYPRWPLSFLCVIYFFISNPCLLPLASIQEVPASETEWIWHQPMSKILYQTNAKNMSSHMGDYQSKIRRRRLEIYSQRRRNQHLVFFYIFQTSFFTFSSFLFCRLPVERQRFV